MHTLTKIKAFRIVLYITYPFALIFVYPVLFLRKRTNLRLYFFFDRFVLGGSQQVHIDILKSIPHIEKTVFFTRRSENDGMKNQFFAIPNTNIRLIHVWCENLIIRAFSVHYFSFLVNRQCWHCFGSNSTFFYDLLPFINSRIIKTDLLHAFSFGKKGIEFFGLANCKYLDNRILIDNGIKQNLIKQYDHIGIPSLFYTRISIISPGVDVPAGLSKKELVPLKILYAGNNEPPKRLYLVDQLAKNCYDNHLPVIFHFAGAIDDALSNFVRKRSVCHGLVREKSKLYEIYSACNVIIITSSREGFPMVIKEGMANGCVPIATDVGGISSHVHSFENGFLLHDPEDEGNLLIEAFQKIELLTRKTAMLANMQEKAFQYAKQNFDIKYFIDRYKEFFERK